MPTLKQIEKFEETGFETEEEAAIEMQKLINEGTAWKLQGSYGRAMMDAIETGACMLGKEDTRDYYGNHIPSRDQVEDGTKGSRDFVADINGEEYAAMLEAV